MNNMKDSNNNMENNFKKLTESESGKLDFYKDFDSGIPAVDKMFSSGERAEMKRKRGTRRFAWATSSSVAAAIAVIVLVSQFGVPGGFIGGLGGSWSGNESAMSTNPVDDEAGSGGEADEATVADGSADFDVKQADSPAPKSNYDKLYDTIDEFITGYSSGYGAAPGDEAVTEDAADAAPGDDIGAAPEAPATEAEAPAAAAPSESAPAPPAGEAPAPINNAPSPIDESPMPTSTADASGDSQKKTEFSDTNIQTEGVQEADIVKTDGRYIYTVNSKGIFITEAGAGHPKVLSKIDQISSSGNNIYFEMYINGNRLILVRHGLNNVEGRSGNPTDPVPYGRIEYPSGNDMLEDSAVDIYDISDKSSPKRVGSLSQSGEYTDSRMIGDKLYMISNYWNFDYANVKKDDPRTYVPLYTEENRQITEKANDVAVSSRLSEMRYTVISGINTSSARFVSHESVLGESYEVYASQKNLYLYVNDYNSEERREGKYRVNIDNDSTRITRVSLNGGKVNVEASANIIGMVNDRFSLDEYKGVLRVVTTKNEYWYKEIVPDYTDENGASYSEEYYDENGTFYSEEYYEDEELNVGENRSNGLYTLDMNMKLLGKVDDLAPDEQVYSCRFMGDVAYFVTFRNTDPLFSVDVSNPKKPKVMGKLKIPGFSEYLQSYSSGLLFGLGSDADEETGEVQSLKVSMFDNSDPYNVTEKHKLILRDMYYTYAVENPKSILVDERKSIVAFPAEGSYVIMKYDKSKGFKRLVDINLGTDDYYDDFGGWYNGLRGIFIDDVFYVIAPGSIHTYDMNDGFKGIDSVVLDKDAKYVDKNTLYTLAEYEEMDYYVDDEWIE